MNLIEEIKGRFQGVKKSGPKGWYSLASCPACSRTRKFYFNEEGRFVCFSVHCGVHGDIKAFGALLRQHGYEVTFDHRSATLDEIREYYDKKAVAASAVVPELCNVSLPRGFKVFDTEHLPAYFVEERCYHPTLPLRFGMGYCTDERYQGRIIVPLGTMANRAFLAYATKRTEKTIKALYPPGCQITRFMWPFNWVKACSGVRHVILVEGITDALRIYSHALDGYETAFPLALLGKNLSEHHLDAIGYLLMSQGVTEVTVCLDGDALSALRSAVRALTRTYGADMISFIDWSRLDVELPAPAEQLDPDNIKDGQLWQKIMATRRQARLSLL